MPRDIRYIRSREAEAVAINRRPADAGSPTSDLGCVSSDKVDVPGQNDASSSPEGSGTFISTDPFDFYFSGGSAAPAPPLTPSQMCTVRVSSRKDDGTGYNFTRRFWSETEQYDTTTEGSFGGANSLQHRNYWAFGRADSALSSQYMVLDGVGGPHIIYYELVDRNDDTTTWNLAGDTHANSVELSGSGKFSGNVQAGEAIHRYKVLLAAGQTVNFSGVGWVNPMFGVTSERSNNIRVTRRDPVTGLLDGTIMVNVVNDTHDATQSETSIPFSPANPPGALTPFSITNSASTTEYVYFAIAADFGSWRRMVFYELEMDLDNVTQIGKEVNLARRSTVHLSGVSNFPFGGRMTFTVNGVEYSEPVWTSTPGTFGSQGAINGAITLDPGIYELALRMVHTGPAARDTRPYSSHFNVAVGDNSETTSLVP